MRNQVRAIVLVLFALGATRSAGAFPREGREAGGVLLVELVAVEGGLQVAQAWFPGTGASSLSFPLLLPEEGPTPEMRIARGENDPGLQVRGRGGAQGEIRNGRLWLSGRPNGTGEFALEVVYRVPVDSSRVFLRAEITAPLSRVQVIHRGGPHALHVRPLRPYGFREEDEGDGPWRYQDLLGPQVPGEELRVVVGRLPETRLPYRRVGMAMLGLVGIWALCRWPRRRD